MDDPDASDYRTAMSDRGGRLRMPASGGGQSSLAATLLGALTCVFGLQFLRLLVVALSVNLVQINELSSVLVGVMGLAVFALGFLAPVVHGILGRRTGVPVILGGLGLLRIAEQFSSSLPVDLALSIAGTVMFLWALPLMLRSLPGAGAAGKRTAYRDRAAAGPVDRYRRQGSIRHDRSLLGRWHRSACGHRRPGSGAVVPAGDRVAGVGVVTQRPCRGPSVLGRAVPDLRAGAGAAVPDVPERRLADGAHRVAAAGGARLDPGLEPGGGWWSRSGWHGAGGLCMAARRHSWAAC